MRRAPQTPVLGRTNDAAKRRAAERAAVLAALRDCGGELRTDAIREMLQRSHTHTWRLLTDLLEEGAVVARIVQDPRNGRCKLFRLPGVAALGEVAIPRAAVAKVLRRCPTCLVSHKPGARCFRRVA